MNQSRFTVAKYTRDILSRMGATVLRWGLAAGGLAAALALACTTDSAVFTCSSDSDCTGEGNGVCQPNGFCAFPDAMCESGFRYGELAGGGFANTCVSLDAGSTGNVGGTDGGSTSTGPVTTTLLPTGGTDDSTGIGESSTSSGSGPVGEDSSTTDPSGGNFDCQVIFNDDFEDGDLPAHWVVEGLGSVEIGTGELRLAPSLEGGDQPIWVRHDELVDFRNAWLMIEVEDLPLEPGFQGIVSLTRDDTVESFDIVIDGEGWVSARRWEARGFTDMVTLAYDYTARPWLRVRESEGRVFFETGAAPDSLEVFHVAEVDIRDWIGTLYVGAFNNIALEDDDDFRIESASACVQP